MLDETEFRRWREAAAGAQQSALLQSSSDQHNWACFLAEQAAQLALKGLLHGVGGGAWGHDLLVLASAAERTAALPLDEAAMAALRRLSRHYIPTRYPDAHPSGPPGTYYGRADAEAALQDLRMILDSVDAHWDRLVAGDRP